MASVPLAPSALTQKPKSSRRAFVLRGLGVLTSGAGVVSLITAANNEAIKSSPPYIFCDKVAGKGASSYAASYNMQREVGIISKAIEKANIPRNLNISTDEALARASHIRFLELFTGGWDDKIPAISEFTSTNEQVDCVTRGILRPALNRSFGPLQIQPALAVNMWNKYQLWDCSFFSTSSEYAGEKNTRQQIYQWQEEGRGELIVKALDLCGWGGILLGLIAALDCEVTTYQRGINQYSRVSNDASYKQLVAQMDELCNRHTIGANPKSIDDEVRQRATKMVNIGNDGFAVYANRGAFERSMANYSTCKFADQFAAIQAMLGDNYRYTESTRIPQKYRQEVPIIDGSIGNHTVYLVNSYISGDDSLTITGLKEYHDKWFIKCLNAWIDKEANPHKKTGLIWNFERLNIAANNGDASSVFSFISDCIAPIEDSNYGRAEYLLAFRQAFLAVAPPHQQKKFQNAYEEYLKKQDPNNRARLLSFLNVNNFQEADSLTKFAAIFTRESFIGVLSDTIYGAVPVQFRINSVNGSTGNPLVRAYWSFKDSKTTAEPMRLLSPHL